MKYIQIDWEFTGFGFERFYYDGFHTVVRLGFCIISFGDA